MVTFQHEAYLVEKIHYEEYLVEKIHKVEYLVESIQVEYYLVENFLDKAPVGEIILDEETSGEDYLLLEEVHWVEKSQGRACEVENYLGEDECVVDKILEDEH